MGKFLIFGATGSIGSNLANKLYEADKEIHLIGRDEEELTKLSSKLSCSYSVLDVLSENSFDKIKNEFKDANIAGIAYCIGSIDLKPLSIAKRKDFQECLNLNFFPIVEIIQSLQSQLNFSEPSKITEFIYWFLPNNFFCPSSSFSIKTSVVLLMKDSFIFN